MRTAFEEEEDDLAAPLERADREVTLSATTLLAVFFGLVLICGLFFGLGYTLGRRASSDTADSVLANDPAGQAPLTAATNQPKPSAATATAPPATSVVASATEPGTEETFDPTAKSPQSATASVPAPAISAPNIDAQTTIAPVPKTPQVKPALQLTSTVATPTNAPGPTLAPVAAVPTAIMVQIAAVSNANDANVLVEALRKRGYSVVIRNQPSDRLLHVQIGPFANRADAVAMRQKLLADGYNAILK